MIRIILVLTCLFLCFSLNANAYQFKTKAEQAIVFDLNSHSTLFEHNSEKKMSPSSMSKLMTLYVAFGYIKAGDVKMLDKFKVSKEAWRIGGSSMFLREGQYVTVQDLIHGIITVSGNDACIVLAEGLAGSQENFVEEMNNAARKLGLTNSNFVNVTGLPDAKHFMTAKDLIILGVSIYTDFPEFYQWFSEKSFKYNNILQKNQNLLLNNEFGVDGMKTGHTSVGKYGIIVSAQQGGRRVFVAVNGLETEQERIREARRLLQYAFNKFNSITILTQDSKIEEINVWYGKEKTVPISVNDNVVIAYPREEEDKVKVMLRYDNIIPAPVKKGQMVGEIHIQIPNSEERSMPVYAMKDIPQLSYLERFLKKMIPIS